MWCPIADAMLNEAVKLTMRLRNKGFRSVFSYKSASLSKQLKTASEQNARFCVIIGDEFKAGNVVVKDMATGQQQTIPIEQFLR